MRKRDYSFKYEPRDLMAMSKAIREKGISIPWMAQNLEIQLTRLYRILNGVTKHVRYDEGKRICRYLNLPMSSVFPKLKKGKDLAVGIPGPKPKSLGKNGRNISSSSTN